MNIRTRFGFVVLLASMLAACGGGGGGGSAAPPAPAPAPQTFTVGGTSSGLTGTVVLQNSGGNNLSVSANGPFTFSTAINSGTAYAVSVLTQPSGQTCVVSNGSGTATANVTTVAIACSSITASTGRFLYVTNNGDSTISAYSINATTGALAALPGSPFPSGGSAPTRLKVHPSASYLYVVNGANSTSAASNNVSVFAINPTTGALSPISGSPYATGRFSSSLDFDSTGTFLYVSNAGTADVSAFRVDATSGALTSVAGSPFAVTGSNVSPISIRVAGGYLYVASVTSSSIHVFSINSATGALTATSTIASGTGPSSGPNSIVINPAGTVAYVGNSGISSANQLITAYTINNATGALTAQPGASTVSVRAGGLTMDPQGRFLLVPDRTTSSISVFPVNATTAALGAAVAGSPFAAGTLPLYVQVNPQGTFAYAANGDSANVSILSFNSTTGVLGASTSVPAGASPNTIAIYSTALTQGTP